MVVAVVMFYCFNVMCPAASAANEHDAGMLTTIALPGYTTLATGGEVLTSTEFGE